MKYSLRRHEHETVQGYRLEGRQPAVLPITVYECKTVKSDRTECVERMFSVSILVFKANIQKSTKKKQKQATHTHTHKQTCLVCAAVSGRGLKSHAYTHSVQFTHHVFLNLHTLKFYCLPDNYEIIDSSLEDITVSNMERCSKR